MRITESKLKEIVELYDDALVRKGIRIIDNLLEHVNATIDVRGKDNEVILVNQSYNKGTTVISVIYHLYQNGTPLEICTYIPNNYTRITLCADRLYEGYRPCEDKPIDKFGNTRQEKIVPQMRIMRAANILLDYAKK